MNRQISDSKKLLEGLEELSSTVGTTLGPKGRNVVIQKTNGFPVVTKDGVSVAKEISFEDAEKNLGVQLVQQVSENTAREVGDGTTTATVLAHQFVKSANELIAKEGLNKVDVKRRLDEVALICDRVVADLTEEIKPNSQKLVDVATIAANNDSKIGTMVAEVVSKVGHDSIISVIPSLDIEDRVEYVDGFSFDKGCMNPLFIKGDKQVIEYDEPYLLFFDGRIDSVNSLMQFYTRVIQSWDENQEDRKPIVIITSDIEDEALNSVLHNAINQNLKSCIVKAPHMGDLSTDVMSDMCALTGATLISSKAGIPLSSVTEKHLGVCGKITISRNKTTIHEGFGDEVQVKERITSIEAQLEASQEGVAKNRLQTRWTNLQSKVAYIHVGGNSDSEIKQRIDRIDDSVCSAKVAVESGVVIGGGYTLARCSEEVAKVAGFDNFAKDLMYPSKLISINAGFDKESHFSKLEDPEILFNAETGVFVNPQLESGIIDPSSVTRTALKNAVSIAGMFILTDKVITFVKEPDAMDLHGLRQAYS